MHSSVSPPSLPVSIAHLYQSDCEQSSKCDGTRCSVMNCSAVQCSGSAVAVQCSAVHHWQRISPHLPSHRSPPLTHSPLSHASLPLCFFPPTTVCQPLCDGMYCTSDPSICASFFQVCDGRSDCPDGSDEGDSFCASWNCTDQWGGRVSAGVGCYHLISCHVATVPCHFIIVLPLVLLGLQSQVEGNPANHCEVLVTMPCALFGQGELPRLLATQCKAPPTG